MATKTIHIADRPVGPEHPPFVIAEMSGNHNQSLDKALEIVDAAAAAGAHALKLQTYTADTMTLDLDHGEFLIDDPTSLWNGYTLYKLYQQAHTPWSWHEPIIKRCAEVGLMVFSTPFDATAVDFLEQFNLPCYKVASFENIDLPLIRRIARTGKPIIISSGMASVAELDDAVTAVRDAGCDDIVLLKCTSSYPASPETTNIRTIPHMRDLFGVQVGLSDHTLGIGVALASVALGATVIEKHFTISRAEGGVDSAFSLEPQEMKELVNGSERVWQALGEVAYGMTEKERGSMRFRRSLYVVQDIAEGDVFTENNLRSIRPGYGLPPKYYQTILGKRVSRDVEKGTAVNWDLVE